MNVKEARLKYYVKSMLDPNRHAFAVTPVWDRATELTVVVNGLLLKVFRGD